MEFLEGGIYRPIRVLFDTPIYDRALQICWTITSYKSQIALMRELLRLQQKKQIPSQVTAEDLISLILEESRNTVRERLWEFELEDFDEDVKPLLTLMWAVNVSNKMRDIEFEARMLLNFPEALPPAFRNPEFFRLAKKYARILRKKQRQPSSSKLLSPTEVVLEVVPRVLQGFWVLPSCILLNMPSKRLSKMSVGVTKAVLDRVSGALTHVERQVPFSRSIRDEMVQSIQTVIREMFPRDVLVNRINSFAPVLLSDIAEVAAGQISELFQPQSPKVPAHLTPTAEPTATTPVQDDSNLAVTGKEPPTASPETNSAVVSTPPASPTPPVELPSVTDVEDREAVDVEASPENEEPTRDPRSAAVPASQTPPAEPPSTTDVEDREDVSDKHCLEKDEPTRDPHSAVVPPTVTLPAEPPSIPDVEAREDVRDKYCPDNDQEPIRDQNSVVVPPLTPPAEPPSPTDVEAREDEDDKHGFDTEPTRDQNSAVVPPSTPPADPPSNTDVEVREDEDDKPSFDNDPDPTSVVPSPPSPPTEPPFATDVEAREDEDDECCLETEPELSREPASVEPPAPPSPLTPPDEAGIITAVQDGFTTSLAETEQPTSSPETSSPEVSAPPAPIEPPITDVQDSEDTNERPSLEDGQEVTRQPVSALPASPGPLTPPLEPVVTVVYPEDRQKRARGFFHTLFQSVCCCFGVTDSETESLFY